MAETTYIFGHRNPDADAICSALAYADLKNRLHGGGFEAARCGNSNARIDAILGRFHIPLPRFIGDVTPRVHDIMVRDVLTVPVEATCAEALALIDGYDVRALPVVDPDNRIEGLVTIFQMGQFFLPKVLDIKEMRHVKTSIAAILKALDATPLHLHEAERIEDLYVRIGAMDIKSFGRYMAKEGTPPGQSIIVVGDRYDIHQKSIQVGIRLVVVSGGLDVDPETVEMARERGVSMIVSPYDSATTTWIIRTATLLRPLMDVKVMTFDADETVNAVKQRVASINAPAFPVVDADRRLIGLFTKSDLLKPPATRIILVDHNEITQAVNGAGQVEILEIIDHHRLGNPPTQQPILFVNEPVGSTCTIVAGLFRRHGLEPAPEIAGVLMGGMISDTLHLQSPTTTDVDREVLAWLAGLAGVPSGDLAETIFSSGSVILSHKPDEVVRSDCKLYREGEIAFSASQIEELGFDNFTAREDELLEALERLRADEKLAFSALLVTDINTQNSLLAVQGDPGIIARISFPHVRKDKIFDLPGIVSRKKQLIPYLTSLLGIPGT